MSTKKNDATVPINKQADLEKTRPVAVPKTAPDDSLNTQPHKSVKKARVIKTDPAAVENAAPETAETPIERPAKKTRRGIWVLIGIAGMLLIVVVGALIGYASAIKVRQSEELNQRLTAATTQYVLGMQDIQNNNLVMAEKRLEYVLKIYPDYPEAASKLTEVLVALAQNNPNATSVPSAATVAPTADIRDIQALYTLAQQQLTSQDWENLFISVNGIRNVDPTFNAVKVDGMYYAALRNVGIKNISKGYLETGIYYLTLASKIGPIDTEAQGYINRAKMYLNAASGFGVDWQRAMDGFATLYNMVPFMIDFNGITVTQRYAQALAGYGDYLQSTYDWCGAQQKYEESLSIMTLQSVSAIIADARNKCTNPPPTPTPTLEPWVTPTAQ